LGALKTGTIDETCLRTERVLQTGAWRGERGIHRVLRSLVGASLNKLGRRRVREGADGGEKATEKMNGESNQRLDGNRSRHRVNTVTMPAIMMERSLNDCVTSIQSNAMLAKYTFRTGEKVWK
jgi:hypothetical protein